MNKFIFNKYFHYFIGLALFFLIWSIISFSIKESDMIFPSPIKTFQETFLILKKSYTYQCIGASFLRMIIGFSFSFALGLILGIIAGNNELIKNALEPTITILKSIPTAAIVFLFLVLIGAKNAPILMVTLISFPIIYESVIGGITNIDKNIINASKIDSTPFLTKVFKIQIPLVIPYILIGIVSSFSLSFKIEIMSEVISGSTSEGLGSIISYYQRSNPTYLVPVFAYSLIAVVFMLIITLISKETKRILKERI